MTTLTITVGRGDQLEAETIDRIRAAEVQAELDIPHGTATTTLARLRDEGYIGKTPDSYYHALPDRD